MTALLDALVAFAREHGVHVDDPVVLGDTSNIVVHLRPAPVVARVAHVTASGRDRPDVGLARELAITRHLHRHGIPTTAPSTELPPGPHRLTRGQSPVPTPLVESKMGRDSDPGVSWWVSFVEFVAFEPVEDGDAAQVGESLAALIETMADMTDDDGLFDRCLADEADVSLAMLEGRIDEVDRALLLELRADAIAEPGPGTGAEVVHADPHRANVGRRSDGEIMWFDFDDAVRDSPLVDLATLHHSWPEAGAVACRRLGVDPDGAEMARFVRQRVAWGDIWTQHFGLVLGGDHEARADAARAKRRR